MDIKEIRQLVKLMVDNDLGELDIADGDKKVSLRRNAGGAPVVTAAPVLQAPQVAAAPAPQAAQAPAEPAKPAENLLEVKSPMVGTFYSAPSPDSDPYVTAGANVADDSVVCIIEAMKVMNEIKAECSGTIVEVCVKNAQPVEYGQVLFRVRPS
jgi:acetyl-CoA carboxylase biotin carboxyl carrier protein